nr:sulfite exporter TauE/SafE family protein [Ruegeria marisrubri]
MHVYLPIAEVSVSPFVLLGIGALVGVLSGMFGVGGGFLITPLLFLIGIPPAVAVATSANQVVASSFSGVLAHFKKRTVDLRMGGVLGAQLGTQIGARLKAEQLRILLSLLVLAVSAKIAFELLQQPVDLLNLSEPEGH